MPGFYLKLVLFYFLMSSILGNRAVLVKLFNNDFEKIPSIK